MPVEEKGNRNRKTRQRDAELLRETALFEIERCAKALSAAQERLAAAINEAWPVGTNVLVERGRGLMQGRIISGARDGRFCGYVLVKGWKHKRAHSIHYSCLRAAGD